jgi:alginate O-acetyltransferase complex protein AlgI
MLLRGAAYIVVFLACAALLTRIRAPRARQVVLLVASYGLYLSWEPWFAAVLAASTLMNFVVGRSLRRRPSAWTLALGVALNLALLGFFKYLPVAATGLQVAALQTLSGLAMPLGISFWTFQAMSYLFDLYREEELDPSLLEFAVYLAFFPVTISGPVCRLPDMLPQFRADATAPRDAISRGFQRIAIGVLMMQFAKLLGQGILAGDGIASGFDRVTHWTGPDAWCLAFGYGLQLFFDFGGYSHIAIGAAQALGFTLPENFDHPFESNTPSMFWTRWHMSLSFWIRDYVFLPLATLRREVWWRHLALLLSMIAFGLWHKASVLFVLWGAYHGALLVAHRLLQQATRRFDQEPPAVLWTSLSWIATLVSINLGWIFFRANSFNQARLMLAALATPASYSSHALSLSLYLLVVSLAMGYALVVWAIHRLDRHSAAESAREADSGSTAALLARWRWFWLPPLYALALLFLLFVTISRGVSTAQMMYGNF